MNDFKKIKRARNLYEDVVKEIKTAILSGKYETGDALPSETELTQLFGVSRPVVREALRSLQSRGFLEIRRGTKGGAYVKDFFKLPFIEDFADLIRFRRIRVDHLSKARLLLEPEICRLTAEKASVQDLDEMRSLIKTYTMIMDRDKLDTMYSLFHRLVGRACGNPLYTIINESIMDFTDGFIKTIKPIQTVIHNDSDHDEILIAFEEHDSEKAAEVGLRHASHILGEMKKLEKTYLELLVGEDEFDANRED